MDRIATKQEIMNSICIMWQKCFDEEFDMVFDISKRVLNNADKIGRLNDEVLFDYPEGDKDNFTMFAIMIRKNKERCSE